ncbi:iron-containing redox enzyme family protein [Micromonospora sp. NPDC023956]|uniref:iron-containing redox enzyme family protein n=1 Tax=Micromonospora sp. NPDC023956 TaxID=3155722 RepID=UPI0033E2D68E
MSREQLLRVLRHLDGRTKISDLSHLVDLDADRLHAIIEPAVTMGLVDDLSTPDARSGLAALSRLEDLLNRLVDELVFRGPFWRAVTERPESLHHNVYYGFGLENWFFLYQETFFDGPLVSHPTSAALRAMLQEFYYEEHRHDDIVLRAFVPLGIGKNDLQRARPLPTTTALINLLSWWSRTDPLFFMATIGILEGRLDVDGAGEDEPVYDSFLEACGRAGVREDFVQPIRAHAKVNASHDHGAVSRELFAEVPGVDRETEQRWHGKAHLFVETYAAFFNGVLDYYSRPDRPLLRPVGIE